MHNSTNEDLGTKVISIDGRLYSNINDRQENYSTDHDKLRNVSTFHHFATQQSPYAREAIVTQSKEQANFSTSTKESRSNSYKGRDVIRVGKQTLFQMDREGNAVVDRRRVGPQNRGVVSGLKGYRDDSYQQRNKWESQQSSGESSGHNESGKLQIGQIEGYPMECPGGQTYGYNSYSQQQHTSSQVWGSDQNAGIQAQQSTASKFASEPDQTSTLTGEANFPALVQKDGKWLVKKVSVDDSRSHDTQTPQEVQPLDKKVTLGAKDQNAPQRREIMKELKKRRSLKEAKSPYDVRETVCAS